MSLNEKCRDSNFLTCNFGEFKKLFNDFRNKQNCQKHYLVGSLPAGRDHRCPPGCWAGVGPAPGSPAGRRSTYPQPNTIFSLQGSTCLHSIQQAHGPNIYKDTKLWMSAFLKKLTSKGTWRQVIICPRPPSPPMTPFPPPPLHTL